MRVTCKVCGAAFELAEREAKCPHAPIHKRSSDYRAEVSQASNAKLGRFDCLDGTKIKSFLGAGGDINARGNDEWTALHRAAFMDLADGVRNLLDSGADPDLPVTPGSAKRTVDIVRHNGKPKAAQIESMLRNASRKG